MLMSSEQEMWISVGLGWHSLDLYVGGNRALLVDGQKMEQVYVARISKFLGNDTRSILGCGGLVGMFPCFTQT